MSERMDLFDFQDFRNELDSIESELAAYDDEELPQPTQVAREELRAILADLRGGR